MHAHLNNAPSPQGKHADAHVADFTAAHLTHAVAAARDPELRSHLAKALAALHGYSHGLAKEHQQAMQGKMSPRVMARG